MTPPADARPGGGVRPLTVVTGALGSGKTTLLRRLLGAGALPRTAVLVNELGEVGLDQHQFRRLDERTVVLPGGCVCCSRRDDVAEALLELLDGEARGLVPPVDRVVLETTGVADPAPVAATLLAHPVLRHHLAVDRVLVTVDAAAVTRRPDQGPEWLQQVVCADELVLTKADLVPADEVRAVRSHLAALNPVAVVTEPDAVDLTAPPAGPARAGTLAPLPAGEHLDGVSTSSVTLPGTVDWAAFAVWLSALLHAHGDRVLRVKALLDTGDRSPVVVDGVQHMVHPPRHLHGPGGIGPDRGAGGPGQSVVVVIARGLPAHEVTGALGAFLGLA